MKKVLAFMIVAAVLTTLGLKFINVDFINSKADLNKENNNSSNVYNSDGKKEIELLYDKDDSEFKDVIYVSTKGSTDGKGTKESPCDLVTALAKSTEAKSATILLMSGIYSFNSTMTIADNNKGSEKNMKILKACKGQDVVLDFSTQVYTDNIDSNPRGLMLNGSYWHVEGLTISGAADTGMLVSGNNNIVENCVFDSNKNSGLTIARSSSKFTKKEEWPSNNAVINCTSKNNCDPKDLENADGFAVKLTCGEGNVLDGCIANNNVDDGFDLYTKKETGPIGSVTIKNCLSIRNGRTEDKRGGQNSNGTGFKLGGEGIAVNHEVTNCMAIENLHEGFTDNNNPAAIKLTNCTAFNNNTGDKKGSQNGNFNMYRCKGAEMTNCYSYTTNEISDTLMNLKGQCLLFRNNNEWHCVKDVRDINTTAYDKQGDVLNKGLTDKDFVSTSLAKEGTNFHVEYRKEDKTIDTKGFGMIAKKSLFYNFSTDGLPIGARF